MNDLILSAQITNLNDTAKMVASSSLIPASLRNKPGDVLVIFMMARELNIPPMQALNGINVISGKPTVAPQLMLAMIRSRVPNSYVEIDARSDYCKCTMSRDKNDLSQAFTTEWDVERAREMGLLGKDNYKKQLGTMLKWRAIGEAARTVFPDVTNGLYLPEEMNNDGKHVISDSGELVVMEKQKPIQIEAAQVENKLACEISRLGSIIVSSSQNKTLCKQELVKSFGTKEEIAKKSDDEKQKIITDLGLIIESNQVAV